MDEHENSTQFKATTRPPACRHCRRLKVRCQTGPRGLLGKCQRCLKAGRSCVFEADREKQQHSQLDSNIVRLEEKIDALAAAWITANSGANYHSLAKHIQGNISNSSHEIHNVQQPSTCEGGSLHRHKRARPNSANELRTSHAAEALPRENTQENDLVYALPSGPSLDETSSPVQLFDSRATSTFTTPSGLKSGDYQLQAHPDTNVIDQGILSVQTANSIFDHYLNNMAPLLPAVVFPPGSDAHWLQLTKPVLFLAILSVGSGAFYPDLHEVLTKRILEVLVDRVILHGQESLEIVQALIVCSTWYTPPPLSEALTFQQLLAMAAVMVTHIIRSDFPQRSDPGLVPLEHDSKENDWNLQVRRAWLGCFILCSKSSVQSQGLSLIRWTSFGKECVEAFEMMPDPLYSDLVLCQIAQYQRIYDDMTEKIAASDRATGLSMTNREKLIGSLEQTVSKFSKLKADSFSQPLLTMCKEAVYIFICEPIMHQSYDKQIFQAPYAVEKLHQLELRRDLVAEEVTGLDACITSAQRWIDSFLLLEPSVIRSLPSFYFSDTVYALIILVAAAFRFADGHGLLRSVFFQTTQLDQYVCRLEKAFRTTAKDQKSSGAGRFYPVFGKVREKIQEGLASQINSESGQYQNALFTGSGDIKFEQKRGGWPEAELWAYADLSGEFENLSRFSNPGGLNQNNNLFEYPSLQDGAILSGDASGHLFYDFEIVGKSGQVREWENSDNHIWLERGVSVGTTTAALGQAI